MLSPQESVTGYGRISVSTPRNLSIRFTKMSGAGNDFVVIDHRKSFLRDIPEFTRNVCHRRFGVGADGLLLLADAHDADFAMEYFNADGSHGGMCGNGGRCISRFAFEKEIVRSRQFRFRALDHVYAATIVGRNVALLMKDPTDVRLDQRLELSDSRLTIHALDTGSPHCVVSLHENAQAVGQDIDQLNVEGLGKTIRHHAYFAPGGTNVNYVMVVDRSRLSIRTYERGVEAETMACGTGSIASCIALALKGLVDPPVTVLTRSRHEMRVNFQLSPDGRVTQVSLEGGADIVFEGEMTLDLETGHLVW